MFDVKAELKKRNLATNLFGSTSISGLCPSPDILKDTRGYNVSETGSVSETFRSLVFFKLPDHGQSPKS
jgi:hypothetical protein